MKKRISGTYCVFFSSFKTVYLYYGTIFFLMWFLVCQRPRGLVYRNRAFFCCGGVALKARRGNKRRFFSPPFFLYSSCVSLAWFKVNPSRRWGREEEERDKRRERTLGTHTKSSFFPAQKKREKKVRAEEEGQRREKVQLCLCGFVPPLWFFVAGRCVRLGLFLFHFI